MVAFKPNFLLVYVMVEENLGAVYCNRDQHKTCMKASINLDHSNRVKIYEILKYCSSFADNQALRNIINESGIEEHHKWKNS